MEGTTLNAIPNFGPAMLALVLGVAAASTSALAAPNLLLNGGFELDAALITSFNNQEIHAGGPLVLHNWTVTGSIDLVKIQYGAITGTSVDLLGSPGPGAVSQSFSTVAGTTYQLDFDYARNGPEAALIVSFGTLAPVTYAIASSQTDVHHQVLTWAAATSGTASVTLSANGALFSGPTIDNVAVTATIPEPQSALMMLAGLGLVAGVSRFKRKTKV